MVALVELEATVKRLWNEEAKKNGKFLKVDEDRFAEEIDVQFGHFLKCTYCPGMENKKPKIRVSHAYRAMRLSRGLSDVLRHEVRHGIVEKIREYVVRQDPLPFMKYFDENCRDAAALVERSSLAPEVARRVTKAVGTIDRSSPEDIVKNIFILLPAYRYSMRGIDYARGMEESFAEDSRSIERNAYHLHLSANACAATGAASFAMAGALYVENHTFKAAISLFFGLTGAAWTAWAVLHAKPYLLPEHLDLTTETLLRFPKAARKYLIAMPPTQGTIPEHLEKLKAYGFDITK